MTGYPRYLDSIMDVMQIVNYQWVVRPHQLIPLDVNTARVPNFIPAATFVRAVN
jgi:hypothetical protein